MAIPNRLILLTDNEELSDIAREYLEKRHVKFEEVNIGDNPSENGYEIPTLLIQGEPYMGFDRIKHAVNTAKYI